MADRFEELRTFVAVVEGGGFAAASERLGLVKSAVSRRVGDLEARLGAVLLDRSGRRLRPTPAGEALHLRVVRLLAELEAVEASASSPRPRLRVEAPVALVPLISPALARFASDHPGVDVAVAGPGPAAALPADVVVGTEGGAEFATVRQHRCVAAAATGAPDAASRRVVVLSAPVPGLPLADPRAGGAPDVAFLEVSGVAALAAAVLAGCGEGILPDFVAAPHLADGTLMELESGELSFIAIRAAIVSGASEELAGAFLADLTEGAEARRPADRAR